jgi:hypothetical protein
MPVTKPIWGLVAEFNDPTQLLKAVHCARREGYRRLDAFSPYPMEELADALDFHRTNVPLVMFCGGLFGCFAGYFMQWWIAVISYPINVGGRPYNSWPSFIPVTFEMTVLISALAGTFGLLALCGLPMPYHPLFNVPRFGRASQDRFFLSIEASDPRFDREATREFLLSLEPETVSEVPH